MNHPLNRRQFLAQSGCAALGTTGLLSTLLNLGLATKVTAATDFDDYKAMVCIFLLGGNDSWNMLAPANADEYGFYLTSRNGLYDVGTNAAGLAIAAAGAPGGFLPIQPDNLPGRAFGVHPNMPEVQQLFNAKNLAFVSNVGSMQRPLADVAAYKTDSSSRPKGLFSHSDQQQQWQTCIPDKPSGIGWAGRAMDILQRDQSGGQKFAFNISLSGTNILQTGNAIVPYSMSVDGLVPLKGYAPGQLPSNADLAQQETYARTSAVNSLMGGVYRNIFEATYAQETIDAQNALNQYQHSLSGDSYPTWSMVGASQLEKQLKLVANVIAAYKDSPTKRQTFFISIGGFDMHHGLMKEQPEVLKNVSGSIGKFWANLQGDVKSKVTLFTASDFGRTLSSNGSGADHGWGGNHMVLGGAVKGGRIYGTYPTFAQSVIASTYDVGQGRMIPNYSVEEYVYPVLKWFGVSDHNLFGTVFPGYAARFGTGGIRQTYPLYT